MSKFEVEQLNRENRQLIGQRERLVAALEEAVSIIEGIDVETLNRRAIHRLRTHLQKAVQNARRTVAA